MNHFDLEMASVLTEVLQSWQEEAQKTWNNTLEAQAMGLHKAAQDMILKAEGEQAEKIAQRPISGYVSYLKEYIKQTAEVVARVSWVARTEEQADVEAQTDVCADAEEVQASSTPEDVDQAKTAKGAPGDHAEPEEDHPPPYEEEAQAAEAAAEEDAGGAAQADPAVSQPGIVAGEPDVQKCKDCQEPVPKNLMKKHKKKECPARIVECILCKMRMTQRVYQAHMDFECENVEATCPKCNESYLRGQYTLHQARDPRAAPAK
ncbi:unnamed protein product [Symbiodinium natans]|uniref:TRAF-type domain-containing protein n=1 Tax=Symbiodinium natans TaxID=878477 RepID=A0A812N3G9_9DINO|nr:unnamed protein product [Symbiodinium natans]